MLDSWDLVFFARLWVTALHNLSILRIQKVFSVSEVMASAPTKSAEKIKIEFFGFIEVDNPLLSNSFFMEEKFRK